MNHTDGNANTSMVTTHSSTWWLSSSGTIIQWVLTKLQCMLLIFQLILSCAFLKAVMLVLSYEVWLHAPVGGLVACLFVFGYRTRLPLPWKSHSIAVQLSSLALSLKISCNVSEAGAMFVDLDSGKSSSSESISLAECL